MTLPIPPPTPQPTAPTAFELETTAYANATRNAMGISKDPIEQTFTETNPRYTFGYLGGFNYKSTASRPLLDHPLEDARMLTSFDALPNTTWQSIYQDLLARLPIQMQQSLAQQANLKNPNFVTLKFLLEITAQVFTTIQFAIKPAEPNSVQESRLIRYIMLPVAALKGALNNTLDFKSAIKKFLEQLGPNHRDFDSFTHLMNQLKETLGLLEQVNTAFATSANGELSPEGKAAANMAASQLLGITSQFDQMVATNDLQIIPVITRTLTILAMALSLPFTASAPLFIGLKMATQGLNAQTNQTGLIGPNLSTAINILTESLATGMPVGGRELFKMLLTVGLASAIGFAAQLGANGFGLISTPGNTAETSPLPDPNVRESKAMNFFAFSTALNLVMHSNLIGEFYKEALTASGANQKSVALGTPLLTQLTHLLMIISGSHQYDLQAAGILVEEQAQLLQKGLTAAETLDPESFKQNPSLAVAIQQLQGALNERNYQGFTEAFTNLLCGPSDNANWTREFDIICNLTSHLSEIAQSQKMEEPLTGIVHVI